MENPLPLKLIEEQELFEKLLELLVLSTHSPKGRFSKDNSYIIFKKKMETTKDGVYAGGDVVTGAATVISAMGAGKKAAKAIDEYLSQKYYLY